MDLEQLKNYVSNMLKLVKFTLNLFVFILFLKNTEYHFRRVRIACMD